MFEVEMKFPVDSPEAVRQRFADLGALSCGTVEQTDVYFSHPSRNFAATDEALRLRTSANGTVLTYKGPLVDPIAKTRREIEVPLPQGENHAANLGELFRLLGFQPAAIVQKRREQWGLDWQGRSFELAIDAVDRLGNFVEIETLAAANDLQGAGQAVQRLAAALQLAGSERRSYLCLLLAGNSQKK